MPRFFILSGEPYIVVGIMRSEFRFPAPDIDVWIAQQFGQGDHAERRSHNYGVIARLKRERSIDAAAAEMRTRARTISSCSMRRGHKTKREVEQ